MHWHTEHILIHIKTCKHHNKHKQETTTAYIVKFVLLSGKTREDRCSSCHVVMWVHAHCGDNKDILKVHNIKIKLLAQSLMNATKCNLLLPCFKASLLGQKRIKID